MKTGTIIKTKHPAAKLEQSDDVVMNTMIIKATLPSGLPPALAVTNVNSIITGDEESKSGTIRPTLNTAKNGTIRPALSRKKPEAIPNAIPVIQAVINHIDSKITQQQNNRDDEAEFQSPTAEGNNELSYIYKFNDTPIKRKYVEFHHCKHSNQQ
jgi:hypothetical protein